MNKNLEQINKDLKTYGIRNNSIVCEAPLEKPSKLILNETSGIEQNYYIEVIGVDNKLHIALPWSYECKCGTKILKKKISEYDNQKQIFGCYECTY